MKADCFGDVLAVVTFWFFVFQDICRWSLGLFSKIINFSQWLEYWDKFYWLCFDLACIFFVVSYLQFRDNRFFLKTVFYTFSEVIDEASSFLVLAFGHFKILFWNLVKIEHILRGMSVLSRQMALGYNRNTFLVFFFFFIFKLPEASCRRVGRLLRFFLDNF